MTAPRSILSIFALAIALAACSTPPNVSPEQAAQNTSAPGWTGRTFVLGSNSTIAGDEAATYYQQKWGTVRWR